MIHDEYELAYDVIRYAMTKIWPDDTGKLQFLRNAIYKAHSFLADELEQMEEEAAELGLDKWIAEEKEEALDEEK